MGHNNYPKTLTAAYGLAINWKGYTKGIILVPNNSIASTKESEEADVYATNGMKITKSGNPMVCHVCGKNQYANKCPDREESVPEKKSKKAEDTSKKEGAPEKHRNVTVGRDWGGGHRLMQFDVLPY